MTFRIVLLLAPALAVALAFAAAPAARAHCDTEDGPVVLAAKRALDTGRVVPLERWVAPDDAPALRDAFASARRVRALGREARSLADRWFFETAVRLHRASEGMAFEGLKPAGHIPPEIAAADRALESGAVDALADEVAAAMADGIRTRFAEARARLAHADDSVEAGRAFVAAYVAYVHFVESAHALALARGAAHAAPAPAGHGHEH